MTTMKNVNFSGFNADEFIQHYGVKGMKWGVRRDRSPVATTTRERPGKYVRAKGGKYQPPSADAIRAAHYRQQAKRSTVDSLSNNELRDLVDRMGLESRYTQLKKEEHRLNAGARFVKSLDAKNTVTLVGEVAKLNGAAKIKGFETGLSIATKILSARNGGGKKKK